MSTPIAGTTRITSVIRDPPITNPSQVLSAASALKRHHAVRHDANSDADERDPNEG